MGGLHSCVVSLPCSLPSEWELQATVSERAQGSVLGRRGLGHVRELLWS